MWAEWGLSFGPTRGVGPGLPAVPSASPRRGTPASALPGRTPKAQARLGRHILVEVQLREKPGRPSELKESSVSKRPPAASAAGETTESTVENAAPGLRSRGRRTSASGEPSPKSSPCPSAPSTTSAASHETRREPRTQGSGPGWRRWDVVEGSELRV